MTDRWFLSLENFKSIYRLERMEGRPITLLLGPNNAGKTSVLQALLLLKGSLANPETVLSFRNDIVDLGSFRQTVTRERPEESIALALEEGGDGEDVWRFLLRVDTREGTLQIREYESDLKEGGQVYHFRYSQPLSADKPSAEYREYENDKEKISINDQQILRMLRWQSFLPDIESSFAGVPSISHVSSAAASQKSRWFLDSLRYIGPLRVYPERSYGLRSSPVPDVGTDGRWAPHILRRFDLEKKSAQLQDLRRWLGSEGFGLVQDIRTHDVEELPGHFVVEVKIREQWVNLRDVGFGMSQLLPIVVESLFPSYRRGSLLLLEQPEIHLHPKAQADLGAFVAEMAQQGRRYLIETHSEYLVMRLATEVRRGKLSPNDIAIYFLSLDKQGHTQFQHIPLEKDGRLPPPGEWPKGFFDTDIEEADAFLFASPAQAEG